MTRMTAFGLAAAAFFALPLAVNNTVEGRWEAPTLLFWIILVAASLCVICAVALAFVAHRNDHAELGFVSIFYFSASLLPLVHGLTIPGVLYGPNEVTVTSAFLVFPAGLAGVVPSLARSTAFGRWVGSHWRAWLIGSYLTITGIGGFLLIRPDTVLAPAPGSTLAIVSATIAYLVAVAAGRRHVWLADVADSPGPQVIAYAYLLLGGTALMFYSGAMWSAYFWLGHGLDIAGVFLATIGGIVVYRRKGGLQDLIRPVTAVDPHAALELSLSPVVHRFVADLNEKDEITRDHVVRTAVGSVDVAEELGLDAATVRRCGTVALLHDVGKLEVPDEILKKPGRLTDAEFDVMTRHTENGARLLRQAPALADIADAVCAHHERIDGRGYPHGLTGAEIPVEARVVSVCDAYDAMSFTRHYREGMDAAKVASILREHAGSQWDREVVEALLRVVARNGAISGQRRLDGVGRDAPPSTTVTEFGCDCLPADVVGV